MEYKYYVVVMDSDRFIYPNFCTLSYKLSSAANINKLLKELKLELNVDSLVITFFKELEE